MTVSAQCGLLLHAVAYDLTITQVSYGYNNAGIDDYSYHVQSYLHLPKPLLLT